MKLFVIAALITMSAAARLEHLEQKQRLRAYLPPHQNSGFGSENDFSSSHKPFGANAGANTVGADQPGFNPNSSFLSASNRYLPPNHELSALSSVEVPQFTGSFNGLEFQDISGHHGHRNTFGAASRFQSHPRGVNRWYLAPHSSQNIPQQAFDEETGYHY